MLFNPIRAVVMLRQIGLVVVEFRKLWAMASVLGHVRTVALERRYVRVERLLMQPVWSERRMLLSLVLWRLETFDLWSLMLRSLRLRLLDIGSTWSSRSLVITEVQDFWSPELRTIRTLVSLLTHRSFMLGLLDIRSLWSSRLLVISKVPELLSPELGTLVSV